MQGTAPEGATLGRRGGKNGPARGRRAWLRSEFGIGAVSIFGPASHDAPVAPDAIHNSMECKEKRRVVGSVG